jgi:hypothetical protein
MHFDDVMDERQSGSIEVRLPAPVASDMICNALSSFTQGKNTYESSDYIRWNDRPSFYNKADRGLLQIV